MRPGASCSSSAPEDVVVFSASGCAVMTATLPVLAAGRSPPGRNRSSAQPQADRRGNRPAAAGALVVARVPAGPPPLG